MRWNCFQSFGECCLPSFQYHSTIDNSFAVQRMHLGTWLLLFQTPHFLSIDQNFGIWLSQLDALLNLQ